MVYSGIRARTRGIRAGTRGIRARTRGTRATPPRTRAASGAFRAPPPRTRAASSAARAQLVRRAVLARRPLALLAPIVSARANAAQVGPSRVEQGRARMKIPRAATLRTSRRPSWCTYRRLQAPWLHLRRRACALARRNRCAQKHRFRTSRPPARARSHGTRVKRVRMFDGMGETRPGSRRTSEECDNHMRAGGPHERSRKKCQKPTFHKPSFVPVRRGDAARGSQSSRHAGTELELSLRSTSGRRPQLEQSTVKRRQAVRTRVSNVHEALRAVRWVSRGSSDAESAARGDDLGAPRGGRARCASRVGAEVRREQKS